MAAERSCEQMQQQYYNCTAIYDADCDDADYRICKEGTSIHKTTKGACIYSKKRGKVFQKIFLAVFGSIITLSTIKNANSKSSSFLCFRL